MFGSTKKAKAERILPIPQNRGADLSAHLKYLIDTVNGFHDNDVDFRSLCEHMDTTTAEGRLTFNLFGSFAQFERDIIRERTLAGLAAARGRNGGRKPKLSDAQKEEIRRLHADGTLSIPRIAELFGVSVSTANRAIRSRYMPNQRRE